MKMRRCEDEKMFYRPPLLEEPCAQTLSGKTSVHSTLELQVQPIPHMFRLTSSLSTTLMPVDHFHHKNRLEPTQQSSASPFVHYCCKFPLFALRTEKPHLPAIIQDHPSRSVPTLVLCKLVIASLSKGYVRYCYPASRGLKLLDEFLLALSPDPIPNFPTLIVGF